MDHGPLGPSTISTLLLPWNADRSGIHTIVLLEFILLLPCVFRCLSPPKSLSYWNHSTIKMFSFLRIFLLLFLAFLSFILLEIFSFFCKICPIHSWGFFQISFCYNFSIPSAIETVQLLKCSAFYALSVLCFSTFLLSNFFRNSAFSKKDLTLNQMGKSSNPL